MCLREKAIYPIECYLAPTSFRSVLILLPGSAKAKSLPQPQPQTGKPQKICQVFCGNVRGERRSMPNAFSNHCIEGLPHSNCFCLQKKGIEKRSFMAGNEQIYLFRGGTQREAMVNKEQTVPFASFYTLKRRIDYILDGPV